MGVDPSMPAGSTLVALQIRDSHQKLPDLPKSEHINKSSILSHQILGWLYGDRQLKQLGNKLFVAVWKWLGFGEI